MLAGFGVGFAVLFSPVWLNAGTLGTSDALVYYYPAWVVRAMGWTSGIWSGYPIQGDPQAMSWYPPALLLSQLPLAVSWNAFVISGYALAASFAYGYAYRITRSSVSACIAGIAYGAGGYAIAHLDHVTMLHGMVWLPLVAWALEALREDLSARWLLVGAGGVGAALLAGHPQVFLYSAVLWAAYATVSGWSAPAGRLRYWASTAGMGLLGVLLASITWLPVLELASHSTRSLVTRAEFFEFSLLGWQLPQLLFPYLLGGAALGAVPPVGAPGELPLPYFGPGRFAEVTGYVGLLPLALAGVALITGRRSRLVVFWGGVAIVALLLALGSSLPLLSELVFHVPGLNRFRVPPRHLLELSLAVACLSALGARTLSEMQPEERMRLATSALLALGAVLALGIVVYEVALRGGVFARSLHWAGVAPDEAAPWRNPALALQLGVLAVGIGALLFWCRQGGRLAAVALTAAVTLDLASMAALGNWRMSPAPDRSGQPPPELAAVRDELRASGQRMSGLSFDAPDNAAPPNRNQLFGLPSALGYGPLLLRHYAELVGLGPAGLAPAEMGRVLDERDRRFDLLAVRYLGVPDGSVPSEIVLRENLAFRPPRRGANNWPQVVAYLDRQPRWRRHATLEGAVVFENTRALPRAWLVSQLRALSPDETLRSVRDGRLPDGSAFDPRRTALVDASLAARHGEGFGCTGACGDAQLLEETETALTLRVDARARTLLVLSDVHYPGWRAWVDGDETEIHRVDHVLRGVVVPAGRHELRFAFESESFRLGAGLSAAAAIALALWAMRLARGRSRSLVRNAG